MIDDLESFSKQYTIITAAGGVVYNKKNELLMIFRNGRWDLPKGKVEDNESIEECALREVREECGIQGLSIIKELKDTYHIYRLNETPILKKTCWFKMYSEYSGELVPEEKEGITKVSWVSQAALKQKAKNSYGNITDLLLIE